MPYIAALVSIFFIFLVIVVVVSSPVFLLRVCKRRHGQYSDLLLSNVNAFSQALNLELLAGAAAVYILDVVGRRLKVAGCIVALGNE